MFHFLAYSTCEVPSYINKYITNMSSPFRQCTVFLARLFFARNIHSDKLGMWKHHTNLKVLRYGQLRRQKKSQYQTLHQPLIPRQSRQKKVECILGGNPPLLRALPVEQGLVQNFLLLSKRAHTYLPVTLPEAGFVKQFDFGLAPNIHMIMNHS